MTFSPYIARDRVFEDFVFDFHITNETGKQWYDGSAQQFMPERKWCYDRIKSGMTVVDCGAHHGMMSVIFAKAVGPTGLVHAYEVAPENANVIRQNAALNNMENILVHPVGVGAESSRLGYNGNLSNIVVGDDKGEGTVQLVALDDDLAAARVDFLKVDVEGFEAEALSGMHRILGQRPLIDLEVHNFLFPNRLRMLDLIAGMLSGLGYRFSLLGDIFGEIENMGNNIDIPHVARFENPHIFCEPV